MIYNKSTLSHALIAVARAMPVSLIDCISISDKTIFPEFIDKLKNIPVDNYKTKLYVKAKNYHELMFYFKQEKKKRRQR